MFNSSKRRGAARDTSGQSAKSRVRRAVFAAIETLETRTLMSTVTVTVQSNSDTAASIVTASGANALNANTLRAAVNYANNESFPVVIQFNAAKFPGGASNTIMVDDGGLTLGAIAPAGTHSYKLIGPTAKPITISAADLDPDFITNAGVSAEFDNLTIANGNAGSANGGGIGAGGPLTLINDTFASDYAQNGGGVYSATGQISVTSCAFNADAAEEGGGLFVDASTPGAAPVVTGSTFTSDSAVQFNGGAITDQSQVNSTFSISNCKFTGDSAGLSGGAIRNYAIVGALATSVTGSTFSGDSSIDAGGAIYSFQAKSLTITTDTFTSDNSTDAGGGAIYSEDSALIVSGSAFKTDSGQGEGGAVFYEGDGGSPVLTVTNSSFTNDSSLDSEGGAIFDETGNTVATITGSTFSGDSADAGGGAIYNDTGSSASLTLANDNISNNTAGGNGGGVYSDAGTLTITGSTFSIDKSTEDNGGGAYSDSTTLTVTSSSFTGDSSHDEGGGLYFDGTTGTVTSSGFTNDSAGNSNGGGIFAGAGTLSVTGSTFTGDSADEGGAIDATVDTLNVTNSTVSNDTATENGGGITTDAGVATITGSIFANDAQTDSSDGGGGIYTDGNTLIVTESIFTGDTSGHDGGAIYLDVQNLNVEQVTFTDNSAGNVGGAIFDDATTAGVFDSTFNGNSATIGGASYEAGGTVNYANDTFNGNSAATEGGGIYADVATLTITDSTLSGNTSSFADGGGIYSFAGDVILDGTIVAGNFVTGTPSTLTDLEGAFSSTSTDNIIGDGLGQTGFTPGNVGGNFVGTDFAPIDPMLGALGNHGGPTQTMVPASTSLAIGNNQDFPVLDADSNDVTLTDQAGNDRPQNQGYDIGAYQTGATPVVVTPTVSIAAPATKHVPSSGTTTILVPVTLSSTATSAIVLTYSTLGSPNPGQTASSQNGDYTGVTNATHTIPAGSPAGTYFITIAGVKHVANHGTYPKTFQVKLTAATNATVVGGTETVTVTLAFP